MARIDDHIQYVRARLLTNRFLQFFAWMIVVWAGAFVLAILLARLFWLHFEYPYLWLIGSIFLAGGVAWFLSLRSKPSDQRVAAMIDEQLNTSERLSTAIYLETARQDPFASAVIADAQAAAEGISPQGRFPLHWPPATKWALAAVAIAILFWLLFPQMDLLHRQAHQQAVASAQQQQQEAKKIIQAAAVKVQAQSKNLADDGQIQQVKRELQKELASPTRDPAQAKRDAAKAMQQVAQAAKQQSEQAQLAAQAEKDAMRQLTPPAGNSSVAKAHQALASGNFEQASEQIKQAAQQAAKNTAAQNQASAKQVQELAKQLQQVAQNNQIQQSTKSQLQQMGFTPRQVQQMTGKPESPSKLREMISKYLPNLPGPQQAHALRLAQQASADQQVRQQAAAMSKSAQQMAKAMQGQSKSQMASAAQSMQQQMQQMQANQQSAQEKQAQASSAQSEAKGAMQSLNQGNQQQGNSTGQQASSQGPPRQGNPSGGNSSQPQPGEQHMAMSPQSPGAAPMYKIKVEMPAAQNTQTGKVLADILVKGDLVKGQALQQLQSIAVANQRESAQDTDPESIDADTRQTVKEYFQAMQADSGK